MSYYDFTVCHNDIDLLVVCEVHFGRDVKHGDFDFCITEVYLDVDEKTNKQGKNLFDDYSDSELDKMTETICEMEDLTGLAYEEACDRADWLRDQRKDEGL